MGREVLEMRRRDCGMLVTLLIAGLLLAACSRSPSQEVLGAQVPPVTVEAIDGTDLKRVTLIPRSAARLRTGAAPWSSRLERRSCTGPSQGSADTDSRCDGDRGAGHPAMMRRLISASLRFRFLVMALASAMMIVGIALIPAMPVDAFPEFAPPRV